MEPGPKNPAWLDGSVVVPGVIGRHETTAQIGSARRCCGRRSSGTSPCPSSAPDQVFHPGPVSVATPGMTKGLLEAHRCWCTLPLAELVAPAATLARAGVRIIAEAGQINEIPGDMITGTPECAAIPAPAGFVLAEGETPPNPDLADTLEVIAAGDSANCLTRHEVRCAGMGYVLGEPTTEAGNESS